MPSNRHETLIRMILQHRPNAKIQHARLEILCDLSRGVLSPGPIRSVSRQLARELSSVRAWDATPDHECLVDANEIVGSWLFEDEDLGLEIAERGLGFLPDAFERIKPHPMWDADVAVWRFYEVEVSSPHLSERKIQQYGEFFWSFDRAELHAAELVLVDRWGVMRFVNRLNLMSATSAGPVDKSIPIRVHDAAELEAACPGMAATLPVLCPSSAVPGGGSAPFGYHSEVAP